MSLVDATVDDVSEIRLYNTPIALVDELTLVEPQPPAWITREARALFNDLTATARADVACIVARTVDDVIQQRKQANDMTRDMPVSATSTMTRRHDDTSSSSSSSSPMASAGAMAPSSSSSSPPPSSLSSSSSKLVDDVSSPSSSLPPATCDYTVDIEAQTYARVVTPSRWRRCSLLSCNGFVSLVHACTDAFVVWTRNRRRLSKQSARASPPTAATSNGERRFWEAELSRRLAALTRHFATSTFDVGQRVRQRAVNWRFTLLSKLVLDKCQPHIVTQFVAFVDSYENFMVTSAMCAYVDAVDAAMRAHGNDIGGAARVTHWSSTAAD